MIVKGKARSGPEQLAAYLMRTTGGEHATILDHGVNDDDLPRTFMIWHVAGEATQGEKTLYHVQIAPEVRYKMTREQYLRSAEILAEELGMANHPRRVVLHDGGDKPHIHVVFQRTKLDTMTLWDDGYNYVKHERASKRMALEFGHEVIPGKHAKRDREKQPEFPRQKLSKAEAQQEKRNGLNPADRQAAIAAIYASTDGAHAFKAALEQAGYLLAKGTQGYVIVDQTGGPSVLTRNIDLKKKEVEVFMAGLPLDQLPTVDEAKALQKQRKAEATKGVQGIKASKFLSSEPAKPASQEAPPALKRADREAQIAALRASADGARAFKAALEQAGYLLAKGERGYLVVDQAGGHSVLARNLGLKQKEAEAFMAEIALDSLPTIEEAKKVQQQRLAETRKPAPAPIDLSLYAPKPAASKFLSPELAQKLEPPAAPPPPAAPEAKPFDYELYADYNRKPAPAAPVVEAPAPVPVPPPAPEPPQQPMAPQDAALEALKKAIGERQVEDARTWADDDAHQLQRLENILAALNAGKAKDFDAIQAGERTALKRRHQQEQRTRLKGFLDAVQGKVNPTPAAEKAEQQRREVEQLQARQVRERKDYLALIAQTKQLEIENLKDRLALQRSDRERQQEEETERYIREYHEAKRIADDLEARRIHEEIEKNDSLREGPPPPRLGK